MAHWLDQQTDIAPTQEYVVKRWREGSFSADSDQLAEEVPVALVYNGVSHVVMLASPQDLEDFALGFSLTEGILQDKSELYGVEVCWQANGIALKLDIASERFMQLKAHRRSMTGRTGCGLCGAESLNQVFHLPETAEANNALSRISVGSLYNAMHDIRRMQVMQNATGATHACAWADDTGVIQHLREDVGRHNALDKLLGALIKQQVSGGFIVTTSRASYEMVQKIAMAGFDVLAAISAPTGLAVRIAETYNITLLGFVRDQQFVAYSHADRVIE